MSYLTTGLPSYQAMPDSPAETETLDTKGVQSLITEFNISEADAIEWIGGMGYDMAREELKLEQLEAEAQEAQNETDLSLFEIEWRIAA